MKDFKITITSVDLKDPAKLACLESIIGTTDLEGFTLIGVNEDKDIFTTSDTQDDWSYKFTLLYSQIKLDPRKLIGEEVEVLAPTKGEKSISRVLTMNSDKRPWIKHESSGMVIRVDSVKLSPTWLKQNFKCEEV